MERARWTEEHDDVLRQMWATNTAAEIGAVLGRSRASVLSRAHVLELPPNPRAGWRRTDAAPIGSTRVNGAGVCVRKVAATGRCARDWEAEHRLVWLAHHGPIPRGHVVAFRPGQATTDVELITLDRLELVTRRQLMRRNTFHRYPESIVRAIQKRAHLTRAIRQLTTESNQ